MTEPGTDLALPSDYDASVTGLEDFGVEDLKLPRLSIDHEKGGYVDSLAPELVYPSIEVIPLGLIKQRVLWPAIMGDDNGNKKPMCRSVDNKIGYPNTVSTDPLEAFPWQASAWQQKDFPVDSEGRTTLPCDNCRLQTWGSHPDGKKTWCSQQHAIVLLYAPEGNQPSMLALFTAQRSSINVSKGFFATIVRQEQPAYAFTGKWGLTAQTRGKNKYYVPTMVISGRTSQTDWSVYQRNYLSVRDMITRAPRNGNAANEQQANVSGQNVAAQNVNTGFQNQTWAPGQPTQPAQPVQQQPVQPAVDPAYEAWKREQAAQAAQAAQQQAAAVVAQPAAQPTPPPVVTGTVVETAATGMPFPGASSGRDDEPLPF